ncbi:MAG: sucrose-6-phosphate hydrolase [Paenibacillus macerans]|uniref:glycoside hydrolase family 32 protein n=1 Tax=Paenibacillus macerans TaxID=44252 RepID=UPI000ECFB595|nr:sucrose-6-phosphate hydrolase [Paenibacillus macerans]MBS5914199.1 sucrose-6-phosphate hydrolase [Paenibacillus macerans]MDU7474272.1 sucrose-6-phosphate hydrolase [Paenibacillus macerans]MEC0139566.1 sucrose-6-phosphate hydrolase [Paenibacillus macerans]UMV45430.1 sucrose-6-phosphate hydrolase [Paenibacillus macerans]GBK63951.1 sucrose-6-phosphate hydrolase [Paenibacillus macerans]
MKMTREEKYRLIAQAKPGELAELRHKVNRCVWRQSYHIQPPTGLLNDPNGFSYYQGEYHLFYQWFPLGTDHGMKYWYHTKSADLAAWDSAGIGIEPGGPYDSHGAYSGSAIEKDGRLYLLYTGNTRDETWNRHPYQCLAWMNESGLISKLEQPVISSVPPGYTDHFRDPKVWKSGDDYYCVFGAQREGRTGAAVLYRSKDLLHWEFKGEIKTRLPRFGYMWECPDYFELDDSGVLLFCPQGLEAAGDRFNNIYQTGYVIGKPLDPLTLEFDHGPFEELDRGFDFYAAQTMQAPDGRRLLVGWMGLPDVDYPTDANGWSGCLTLPRQLTLRDGKLIQQPVPELAKLRKAMRSAEVALNNETKRLDGFEGISCELICEVAIGDAEAVGLEFRAGGREKTVLKYDGAANQIILDRSLSGKALDEINGNIRRCRCRMAAGKLKFHLFVDASSVEIFVNDGEEVFTSRIFPDPGSTEIRLFSYDGSAEFRVLKWDI